ncbi:hypothetical protein VTI74DRAFT_9158 [Chaetomium olivicolor]
MLDRYLKGPANAYKLQDVDNVMENEVKDKCFFEFVNGGDGSGADFYGKVNLLAKYRLMKDGIDISPEDPDKPQLKLAAADVNEFGEVTMNRAYLGWDCHEDSIVHCIEYHCRSRYGLGNIVNRQLRELDTIQQPADAVEDAKKLSAEIKAMKKPDWIGSRWVYSFCGPEEMEIHLSDRAWSALRCSNDEKMMKRWPESRASCLS